MFPIALMITTPCHPACFHSDHMIPYMVMTVSHEQNQENMPRHSHANCFSQMWVTHLLLGLRTAYLAGRPHRPLYTYTYCSPQLKWYSDSSTDRNSFTDVPLGDNCQPGPDTPQWTPKLITMRVHTDQVIMTLIKWLCFEPVTSHTQVTVTLMWENNPTQKGFLTQNVASILVSRLNSQTTRPCASMTTLHTSSIPHWGPHVLSSQGRPNTQHFNPALTVFFLTYLSPPMYQTLFHVSSTLHQNVLLPPTHFIIPAVTPVSVLRCWASACHDYSQPYNRTFGEEKRYEITSCAVWMNFGTHFNCITVMVQTGCLQVIPTQSPDHYLHL